MTMRRLVVACLSAAAIGAGSAQAAPVAVSFDQLVADGVLTAAGSGSIGRASGLTFNYTILDPSAYAELFWGPATGNAIQLALDGAIDEAGETLAFEGLTGNSARWSGVSSLSYFVGPTLVTQEVETRFELVVTAGGGLLDPAPEGIPADIGAVHPVTGNYSVNLRFLARHPLTADSYVPVLDLFDALQTSACSGGCVKLNFTGGFFLEAAETPEPMARGLLGVGLLGLAGARRARSLCKLGARGSPSGGLLATVPQEARLAKLHLTARSRAPRGRMRPVGARG